MDSKSERFYRPLNVQNKIKMAFEFTFALFRGIFSLQLAHKNTV